MKIILTRKKTVQNIQGLSDETLEYYMRPSGVPLLAYGEMVSSRRLLRKYTDDEGYFDVVVTVIEIENLMP